MRRAGGPLGRANLVDLGGVPERPNGTVSKTVVGASSPWVQIPPPPPFFPGQLPVLVWPVKGRLSSAETRTDARSAGLVLMEPGWWRRVAMNMYTGRAFLYTLSSMSRTELSELPPIFRYSDAIAGGISAERLYSYRDQGLIEQVGRGLYRRSDEPPANFDLLEIAYRAPNATLCLVTALAHHNLTDIIPGRIDIAVPRGTRSPRLAAPVWVHVFNRETFDIGRERLDLDGEGVVGLYSPERTIIDMVRLRHREGAEVAWEAMRRWLRRRGSSPASLVEMARSFSGAETAIRKALEIVL